MCEPAEGLLSVDQGRAAASRRTTRDRTDLPRLGTVATLGHH
jgi:hypothetical protein